MSRSPAPLADLKRDCPDIQIIAVDLAGWKETRAALKDVPTLDGLVNNAGIAIIKPFLETTEEDYDAQFNVNFKAVFNICQFLAPRIRDGGSIINVSSIAALIGIPGHAVYGATKGALDNFAKNLAIELGPRKIRVNNVNPTVILTRMGIENWSDPAKADPVKARIPLGRFGEVREVVEPIMFLLSNGSSYVNGQTLPLEGGLMTGQ